MKLKLIGFTMKFNGKAKCDACDRLHSRSFLSQGEDGKIYHFGSGCIAKIYPNTLELASTLSKVTVQTARLSMELQKKGLLKQATVVAVRA